MKPILLLLLAIFTQCFAGEAELPSSTKSVMDAFTKESDKLTVDYNKSMASIRSKAIAGLTKTLENETKKGNLDGALAIKKKIEELTALNDDGTDLLGNSTISSVKVISAKWGAGDSWVDATAFVQADLADEDKIMDYPIGWSIEGKLGDPKPHTIKSLVIEYEVKGKKATFTAIQKTPFKFPPDK